VRPSTQRGVRDGQEVKAPHSQTPATHVPTPHPIPHPPQFAGSVAHVAGSTHAPSQTTCPAGHAQVPDVQVAPAAQTTAHAPQFEGSAAYVAGSTHTDPHRSCPDGQLRSGDFGEHAASASAAAIAASGAERIMAR
jgi:hypothetical protein